MKAKAKSKSKIRKSKIEHEHLDIKVVDAKRGIRATWMLLNTYFWKTIHGPIMAFIFPGLLLLILGSVMNIQYVFPGIVAMAILFISVQSMSLAILEFKSSSLFKHIGASPISNKSFAISIISYFFLINICSYFLLLLLTMVFFPSTVFHDGLFSGMFTLLGSISFVIAIILHILLSLSIGLVITTFSRTPQESLTISLLIIIPSMFLSGMVISVDIIAKSQAMQWLSRFMPFRYTVGNMVIASTPKSQIGGIIDKLSLEELRLIFSSETIHNIKGFNHSGITSLKIAIDNSSDEDLLKVFNSDDVKNMRNIISNDTKEDILFKIEDIVKKYKTSELRKFFDVNIMDDLYASFDINDLKVDFNLFADSWNEWADKDLSEYNLSDVKDEINDARDEFLYHFPAKDPTLFQLIFIDSEAKNDSDNFIFKLTNNWGVRRVPSIDEVKSYVINFFQGSEHNKQYPGSLHSLNDAERFNNVYSMILKNNYQWLNVFIKQQIKMYNVFERWMNLILPVVMTSGLVWLSIKKFSWTSR